MKRKGYLYENVYDLDNLRIAHKNARKDKSFYKEVKYGAMDYNQWCSLSSYEGVLNHCNSYRLKKKYLYPLSRSKEEFYQKCIKEESI